MSVHQPRAGVSPTRRKGKRFTRRIAVVLAAMALALVCFSSVSRAVPPDGEAVNRIGYTNSSNGSILRSGASTTATRLALLPNGTRVEVYVKVEGEAVNGINTWYYVRAVSLNLEGYLHSPLVTLTNTPIDSPEPGEDPDFEAYLTAQGFPDSYKPGLRSLHQSFPRWIFTAQHIKDVQSPAGSRQPLTFQKALNAESKPGLNLVGSSSLLSHRSYEPQDYYYATNTWKIYDAGGWRGASREIIAYSLDPRNFLTDQQIFQFEVLSYNNQAHPIEAVQAALAGTFMANKTVTFIDHRDNTEKTMTYPEIFIAAAEITGINPFFLAQRCLMEVGRNGSDSVSGTVPGFEGYYNYYNIGATAGTNPILNSLRYARYGSTGAGPTSTEREQYLLPWDSPWRAIVGGAAWIGRGYINAGQDTQYLQKFNLDGDTYGTYWHQYMGNVYAPYYESARVYDMYRRQNLLSMPFLFKIPVLTELPAKASPYPTSNKSLNNWLKEVTVSQGTLTPAFHSEKYAYTVDVDGSVGEITIAASPYLASCTVQNTGTHTLKAGVNEVILEAVSERGTKRLYTIRVNRTGEAPPDPTPHEPKVSDGYAIRGGFLLNAWPDDGRNRADRIRAALDIPEGMSVRIRDAAGAEASDASLLGTGSIVEWFDGVSSKPSATLTLVIYGDPSGDGKINSNDLSDMLDQMLRGKVFPPARMEAMDPTRDGRVNSNDISAILDQMLRGTPIAQN